MGVVGSVMVSSFVALAPITGALQAVKQRDTLCDNINRQRAQIKQFIEISKDTFKQMHKIDDALQQQIIQLQMDISETTGQIAVNQANFQKIYQQLQILLFVIVIMVAVAFFLKHFDLLTLHPLG